MNNHNIINNHPLINNHQIKLYSVKNYKCAHNTFIANNFQEVSIDEAINMLSKDNYYNMRIKHNTQYVFFGELDHYDKPFQSFVAILQNVLKMHYRLELDINDVKYTVNTFKPNSYHFTIPKWNTTIEKLKEIFLGIKEVDTTIYCEHWFRYPNQSKGDMQHGIHEIVNGTLRDFIIDYIPNESININNVYCDYILHNTHLKKYNDQIDLNPEPDTIKHIFDYCYKQFRSDDYYTWLSIGMALKNTYDDSTAVELFDYFSCRSNKYLNFSNLVRTFDHLKRQKHGYTIKTLYYYAIEDNKQKFFEIMHNAQNQHKIHAH